ncbi:hypothetical protein DFH06DRAFT_1207291 [Mycena polygramma]|nr:hypothetical protein DFH06DRAFT_1207291 [Mycena polygramma]
MSVVSSCPVPKYATVSLFVLTSLFSLSRSAFSVLRSGLDPRYLPSIRPSLSGASPYIHALVCFVWIDISPLCRGVCT